MSDTCTTKRPAAVAPFPLLAGLLIPVAFGLGCGEDACDRSPPNEPTAESIGFPVSLVAHRYEPEDLNLLFVVNGNFDLGLRGGSVVVLDIDVVEGIAASCADMSSDVGVCLRTAADRVPRLRPEPFIHALDAVRVASYAREVILSGNGRNLYLTSGGDDSVTWIEVEPDRFGDRPGGLGILSCFAETDELDEILLSNEAAVDEMGDIRRGEEVTPLSCAERWRPRPELVDDVGEFDSLFECMQEPDAAASEAAGLNEDDFCRLMEMRTSPFGLALNADETLLHVTSFDDAALSVFLVCDEDRPCDDGEPGCGVCVDGQPVFLNAFDSVTLANGVAVHATTDLAYVTGRSPAGSTAGVRVDIFETAAMADDPDPFVTDIPEIEGSEVEEPVRPLVRALRFSREAGHDLRGIRFSTDGTKAYLVERSGGADSLLVVDIAAALNGELAAPFVTAIDVGRGAQHVRVVPGAASAGGDVAVVSCFTDADLYVVDLDLLEVVQIIPTDSGPFGLALWPSAAAPERLFVASFTAATVSAIDVTAPLGSYEMLYTVGRVRISE